VSALVPFFGFTLHEPQLPPVIFGACNPFRQQLPLAQQGFVGDFNCSLIRCEQAGFHKGINQARGCGIVGKQAALGALACASFIHSHQRMKDSLQGLFGFRKPQRHKDLLGAGADDLLHAAKVLIIGLRKSGLPPLAGSGIQLIQHVGDQGQRPRIRA